MFQDVLGAFNPHATVTSIIEDPLRIHNIVPRTKQKQKIAALLDRIGLPTSYATHSIRDISNNQHQRIAIARAITSRPSLIVLNKTISTLDVSLQKKILKLLVTLHIVTGNTS